MRLEVCESIMEETVISVAVVGSVAMKEKDPAASHTLKEIAGAATECCKAGTALTHIHVRYPVTGILSSRFELCK